MKNLLTLKNNEIHIWDIDLTTSNYVKTLSKIDILSLDEKVMLNQFKFKADKQRYLLSHIILRLVISRYINLKPSEINFIVSKSGKPGLQSNQVCFNLSHTKEKLLVAISCTEIGIDLEKHEHADNYMDISNNFFTEDEINSLITFDNKKAWFYYYWTRKEALIKAIGSGLSINLKELNTFNVSEYIDGNSNRWQLSTIPITKGYSSHVAYLSNVSFKIMHQKFEFLENEI